MSDGSETSSEGASESDKKINNPFADETQEFNPEASQIIPAANPEAKPSSQAEEPDNTSQEDKPDVNQAQELPAATNPDSVTNPDSDQARTINIQEMMQKMNEEYGNKSPEDK